MAPDRTSSAPGGSRGRPSPGCPSACTPLSDAPSHASSGLPTPSAPAVSGNRHACPAASPSRPPARAYGRASKRRPHQSASRAHGRARGNRCISWLPCDLRPSRPTGFGRCRKPRRSGRDEPACLVSPLPLPPTPMQAIFRVSFGPTPPAQPRRPWAKMPKPATDAPNRNDRRSVMMLMSMTPGDKLIAPDTDTMSDKGRIGWAQATTNSGDHHRRMRLERFILSHSSPNCEWSSETQSESVHRTPSVMREEKAIASSRYLCRGGSRG